MTVKQIDHHVYGEPDKAMNNEYSVSINPNPSYITFITFLHVLIISLIYRNFVYLMLFTRKIVTS